MKIPRPGSGRLQSLESPVNAGGYTFIEVLLVLVVISSIAVLIRPRIGTKVEAASRRRYHYAVSRLATEAWRQAQLQGTTMHMVFGGGTAAVRWHEGDIVIPFPRGFSTDPATVWLFPPDGYPDNPDVCHRNGPDSLIIRCVMNGGGVGRS